MTQERNVVTPIMTMVEASNRGLPYACEGSSRRFSKGQPNGSSHSIKAWEQWS
jgi:hypothetical protein